MEIRILEDNDGRRLESYLRRSADSSMFLRSNLRQAGLVDGGKPLQGTYAAALRGRAVVGVLAHYWNGNLVPQAPCGLLPALADAAVAASDREIRGMLGPAEQVATLFDVLGFARRRCRHNSCDGLYGLELSALRVPRALSAQRITARTVEHGDRERVVEWLDGFEVEALGMRRSRRLTRDNERRFTRACEQGAGFILLRDGQPVAYSGFSARLPDSVQVGPVYTPVTERGKGFARCAVAHSLEMARRAGVRRAVLFAEDSNAAALRAYRALGFERIGAFRLALL